LLLYWAEMMADADLAADIGDRFDHVLVDEYQDTNRLQAKILTRLATRPGRVVDVAATVKKMWGRRAG
jgi:DNA helicase-2/ATP-dependent DNA helicase PcrA